MIYLSLCVGEIIIELYIEILCVLYLCFIVKSLYEFFFINVMLVYNKYIKIFFNFVKFFYEIYIYFKLNY